MDKSDFVLTPHKHELVSTETGCPECLRQYALREALLASMGYAAAVCGLFAKLNGKMIRYRQDKAWGFGRVINWEYPNCCLEIEEPDWAGEECGQKSRWLRFGWCGLLDKESQFVILTDD